MLIDNRVTIAELRGDVYLDEDARQLLDVVFADKPRVICRTAGDDVDLIERVQIVRIPCEFFKGDRLLVCRNALAHRIAHSLRLLIDLLEHEVLIAALLRSLGIPRNLEHFLRNRCAQTIRHLDCVLADNGKLAVSQNIGAARPRNDGGNIGCDEILSLAKSDDERIVLLRAEQHIRMSAAHERERVRPLDPLQNHAHCGDEIPAVDLFQEVCDNFRIRLGLEDMPLCNQFFLQRKIVLDNAVVHDGKIAVTVRMRMGVDIRRTAVRCPARMSDAEAALWHISLDLIAQRGKTSHALLHANLAVAIDGDARRVVATVFQLRQTIQQELCRLTIPDITNNSTHKNTS